MQLVGVHSLAILLCNLISLKHEDHELRLLHCDIRVREMLQGSHVIAIPHFYSFERILGLTVTNMEFVSKL
jgi:hypothetical protein